MNSIEELITITEQSIVAQTGKPLSFIQKAILRESLSEQKQTYAEIAQKYNYSEGYIKKVAAPRFWQFLSEILDEKVNKYNCRILLEQQQKNYHLSLNCDSSKASQAFTLELPAGYVPLNSPFYIARADLESTCYQEINQLGAFLRIKAPRKMGKTSLAMRILAYGAAKNYQTAYLTLEPVETVIFNSISQFIRWFCANVAQQWQIESKLDDYWDEDMGVLMSCTIYFQEYLLKQLSHPAVLILDESDRLFEYPGIAHDFLALLRSWHEKSKDITLWQKLRLVIVNSTDAYLPLKTNQSPFNVGLTVNPPPFSNTELENLAQRHQLKINAWEIEELVKLTGGHPYLLRLALYASIKQNISLKILLSESTTETGVFKQQLHYLLWNLRQNQNLWTGFQQVLDSTTPLTTEVKFKLSSLGLVNLSGDRVIVSCGLYKKYFQKIYSIQQSF